MHLLPFQNICPSSVSGRRQTSPSASQSFTALVELVAPVRQSFAIPSSVMSFVIVALCLSTSSRALCKRTLDDAARRVWPFLFMSRSSLFKSISSSSRQRRLGLFSGCSIGWLPGIVRSRCTSFRTLSCSVLLSDAASSLVGCNSLVGGLGVRLPFWLGLP